MKSSQLIVAFALLACTVMTHDMSKRHLVTAPVTFWSWFVDLFFLTLWTIPYSIFILPIGALCAFFNAPQYYQQWYEGLVMGPTALTVMMSS